MIYNQINLRNLVFDTESLIPVENGTVTSINFDNAGTTPPFFTVIEEINKYSPYFKYTSKKSLKATFLTEIYEKARNTILEFVNADIEKNTVVYTKNTTEAINIISNVICARRTKIQPIVLTTYMEHLSNYLPWKYRCPTDSIEVTNDGRLSLQDLEYKLNKYRGRVKLVTVVGASNVTGYINPIHKIAKLAHKYGAEILVDAAQLIQHHPINMSPKHELESIDYLVFCAHKTYAPYYTGALIAPKKVLNQGLPLLFGAGITESVTDNNIVLRESPYRYEAGSNNILGVIALDTAFQTIKRIGFKTIRKQELSLLSYAYKHLKNIPDVIIYGDINDIEEHIPIIAFNIKNSTHETVAKVFSDEYGIAIKNGYCGADLYVKRLLKGSDFNGVVRISMALYNEYFEIDRAIEAINSILQ